MTFEAIIGIAVFLAIFATIMFFALRKQQRESQQVMEAYEAGDRAAVWIYILLGVVTLTGFVVTIGYEEGVEGVISLFAGVAVFGGLFFFAVWCSLRLRRRRLKRDDSASGPAGLYGNIFGLAGMLMASAAVVGGTATLVLFHGAATIIIYYVVIPLTAGLILFLRWSYRRLRRKFSPGSGLDGKAEP